MLTIKKYKRGVLGLIERIKIYAPEIGRYQNHSIRGSEIVVFLSNGTLQMPEEAAHLQELLPKNVPEEWITTIGDSFKRSNGQVRNEPWLLRLFGA